jgi:hypothetical protein
VTAPELSEVEAAKVAKFGLDDPESDDGFPVRCPDHQDVDLERLDYASGKQCPTCKKVICTRCGKPDQGAWLGGLCDSCYGVVSKARAEAKRISDRNFHERVALRDAADAWLLEGGGAEVALWLQSRAEAIVP